MVAVKSHVKPVVIVEAVVLQGNRRRERLERTQRHGEVARVLGQLATAGLAFLPQLHELRNDHSHHLHDDRGGDVGHHAHGEDGQAGQGAAREHVHHAEDRVRLVLEERRDARRIDARHRNEGADAVHDQRADQEHQARANLPETGRIAETGDRTAC